MREFITKWQAPGGAERVNYQLFLADLCDLLDIPQPDASGPDAANAYLFERAVTFRHRDGARSTGFIDRTDCSDLLGHGVN